MNAVPLPILFDNPIVVKHLRSRLRPGSMVVWLGGVVLVCVAILGIHYFLRGGLGLGHELEWLLALQAYLIGILAAYQAGSALGGARESGTFEYYRLSPLPPSWVGLGFLIGAPIREWLLWGATLPFTFLATSLQSMGVAGFVAVELPLVLGALLLQALSVLVALVSRKPKNAVQGGLVGGLIFLLGFSWPVLMWISRSTGLQIGPNEGITISFYGLPVPWLAFVVLYLGWALGFTLLAVVRKSTSDRTRALSKPEALACMMSGSVLAVGAAWDYPGDPYVAPGLLYLLVVGSSFLVATVAVDRGEYVRGLKRAWRDGRRRPRPWDPNASGQWTIYTIAAVVAIAGGVAWERLRGPEASSPCVALAAFMTAEMGLGYQFARLRLGRYGGFGFTLFMILAWLAPLLVAALLFAADRKAPNIETAAAFSPLAGLGLAASPDWEAHARAIPGVTPVGVVKPVDVASLVAILPTLGFAGLFNLFLITCQRRIDRDLRLETEAGKSAP